MTGHNEETNDVNYEENPQELSVEKACQEYNDSVKLTLTYINHQLDDALLKNRNGLDELAVKIAARTSFLEKNPSFLSCLVYNKECVKCEPLLEFDEIKITLKEHSKRIQEKLDEIQEYHKRLLELVALNGQDSNTAPKKDDDEDFHDCLEKPNSKGDSEARDFNSKGDQKEENSFYTPSVSYDKVTIQKNAFSEVALNVTDAANYEKNSLYPDVVPVVERRRPNEDIHGKMVKQLVQTDSLEGFLKLMERKPSTKTKKMKKEKEQKDLGEKYTGSLWFFPAKPIKRKANNSANSVNSTKKPTLSSSARTCCNLLVTSSQPSPMTNQNKTIRVRQRLERNKLKCYDLLDDIDYNDLKPIQSEYPRRDNVTTMKLQDAKSYLHRIMQENDKVWKKLIQPIDARKKQENEVKKKVSRFKAKQVKNLMEYLTAPEQKLLSQVPPKQTLIVMPVRVMYDNFPTKEKSDVPRAVMITDLSKGGEAKNECDLSQGDEGKTVDSPKKADQSAPFPIQKKKEMLDQLKGLKMKNDNIQKNIQKAIDVIESKMIDLLSSPTDASSNAAFCAMEKEITSVLKLMSDSNQGSDSNKIKEKNEKVEPEKDENVKTVPIESPKQNTVKIVKKKVTLALEGGDNLRKKEEPIKAEKEEKVVNKESGRKSPEMKKEEDANLKKKSEKKLTEKENKNLDKENELKEEDKKPSKENEKNVKVKLAEKVKEKVKKIEKVKKRDHSSEKGENPIKPEETNKEKEWKMEVKKTANIEEGERLLGQVDSVIKKIDSIYNKFYDESKTKKAKNEANFGPVFEFLDDLIQKPEPLETYRVESTIPQIFKETKVFHQPEIFYTSRMDWIPPVPKQAITEIEEKKEMKLKPVQIAKRHCQILETFYVIFFSTIFFALNFDYVS